MFNVLNVPVLPVIDEANIFWNVALEPVIDETMFNVLNVPVLPVIDEANIFWNVPVPLVIELTISVSILAMIPVIFDEYILPKLALDPVMLLNTIEFWNVDKLPVILTEDIKLFIFILVPVIFVINTDWNVPVFDKIDWKLPFDPLIFWPLTVVKVDVPPVRLLLITALITLILDPVIFELIIILLKLAKLPVILVVINELLFVLVNVAILPVILFTNKLLNVPVPPVIAFVINVPVNVKLPAFDVELPVSSYLRILLLLISTKDKIILPAVRI